MIHLIHENQFDGNNYLCHPIVLYGFIIEKMHASYPLLHEAGFKLDVTRWSRS